MLLSCVAYKDGHKLTDIHVSEIPAYLERPDCFVWVALKDPEPAELDDMQTAFGLHELAVEDARHGHQRPKVEEYGLSLFVVLHVYEMIGDELSQGDLSIFIGPRYALTVRRGLQHGFSDVRVRSEQEPELLRHGPAYVLYAVMDAAVDRYFPVIDQISEEIAGVEERIFAGRTNRESIESLYSLKGRLNTIRQAVGQISESASKLHGGRVPPLCAGLQEYFRDIDDHLVRLTQLVDNLRDTVTTAISVNLSLLTIQESEVTKQLASYAALIAVPTLIAGIYGMNFQYMPEISWKWGYPLAVGTMVIIDIYLFLRFRKAGWL